VLSRRDDVGQNLRIQSFMRLGVDSHRADDLT
jgi:hypothetical protein